MVVIRWNKRRLFLLLATYLLLNVASSLVNIARSRAQIFACKKRERVVRERMEGSVILGGQDSPRKWETIEGGRGSPLCCEEQSTRGPFLRIRKRWCTPPTLCNGEWRIGESKLNWWNVANARWIRCIRILWYLEIWIAGSIIVNYSSIIIEWF